MTVTQLPAKRRNVPQSEDAILVEDRILAIIVNPHSYRDCADLIPEADRTFGGRPRVYPNWLVDVCHDLCAATGSARQLFTRFRRTNLWEQWRETLVEMFPDDESMRLPEKPPSRAWFVRRRQLIPEDQLLKMQTDLTSTAIDCANEIGLLSTTGGGSTSHPVKSRTVYADGKVLKAPSDHPYGTTRRAKFYESETGEVTTGEVLVRSVPDARVHPVGGRRDVEPAPTATGSNRKRRTGQGPSKPRKEAVYGTYFWHAAARGPRQHERIILQVDHVPAQKGKSNSEIHVAERNLISLGRRVPGILAFVTDNVFGGSNIDAIQRATGKTVICPVTAQRVLPDGARIEKETKLRDVEFRHNGRTETVEVWTVGGRAHQRIFSVDGESFFEPLVRRESFFRKDKKRYRAYVTIDVPNPIDGGAAQVILERAYNRDDNRVENLRMIPPGDPDYAKIYPLKSDAESINRGIDDALPLRRARSYTAKGQLLDLIGHARAQNSLSRHLYSPARRRLPTVA